MNLPFKGAKPLLQDLSDTSHCLFLKNPPACCDALIGMVIAASHGGWILAFDLRSSRYSNADSCFRCLWTGMTVVIDKARGCTRTVDCSIAPWALTVHGLSWDEDDHRFAHFLNQQCSLFLFAFARFLYLISLFVNSSPLTTFMHFPLFSLLLLSTFDSFLAHIYHSSLFYTFTPFL